MESHKHGGQVGVRQLAEYIQKKELKARDTGYAMRRNIRGGVIGGDEFQIKKGREKLAEGHYKKGKVNYWKVF